VHISEFQGMMRRLYFRGDSKRGARRTYDWLVDETRELGDALKNRDKQELASEFADVIAWLASLANVVNVDLEEATLSKYENKCPKCRQSPCRCTFRACPTDVSAPHQ
jgi:NTP pyrophosphatase (non-canonical NTP hydrolase)